MRCIKCSTNNINKANYCKNCGYKFSDAERVHARRHTLVGKLEMLENAYKVCTLNVITGHIAFKIVSLVIVILMGVYFVFYNGGEVKILKSDKYNIEYNVKSEEYYLLVNEDEVNLNLYVPNKVKNIVINHYDKDDKLLDKVDYLENNDVVLSTNYKEDYYVLSSDNKDIRFYVYRTEV